MIAGAGNLVAPQATADAVLPAFLFLSGCGLAVALAFTFVPIETHGKPLTIGNEEHPTGAAVARGRRDGAGVQAI